MNQTYEDLHLQLLAGEWRDGSDKESRPVLNPYTSEPLLAIRSATADDLDTSYQKAAKAQTAWAETSPEERAGVMLKAVAIFDQRKDEFTSKIKAGMVHVNDMSANDEAHMPFGGEKNSGLGRFNGDWAINEFTTVQWISVQREPRAYPF